MDVNGSNEIKVEKKDSLPPPPSSSSNSIDKEIQKENLQYITGTIVALGLAGPLILGSAAINAVKQWYGKQKQEKAKND